MKHWTTFTGILIAHIVFLNLAVADIVLDQSVKPAGNKGWIYSAESVSMAGHSYDQPAYVKHSAGTSTMAWAIPAGSKGFQATFGVQDDCDTNPKRGLIKIATGHKLVSYSVQSGSQPLRYEFALPAGARQIKVISALRCAVIVNPVFVTKPGKAQPIDYPPVKKPENTDVITSSADAAATKTSEAPKVQEIARVPTKPDARRVKTVAILPFSYFEDGKPYKKEGADEPPAKGRDVLEKVFEKVGCSVIPDAETIATWREMGESTGGEVPSDKTLLKLGQSLGVDYVCAGKGDWKITTPWTITGPKTKAECTLSMALVDVKQKELQINPAEKTVIQSDKKLKSGELAVFLIIYPYTWFSGGPKTPQMEKSLVYAIGTKLEPWLQRHTRSETKTRRLIVVTRVTSSASFAVASQ